MSCDFTGSNTLVMRQQKDKWSNMVLVGEKLGFALQEGTVGLPTAVLSMKLTFWPKHREMILASNLSFQSS